MKTIKLYLSNLLLVILMVFSVTSCQKLPEYPTIPSVPCVDINVIADPNIINDFNCQANITLPNVEVVNNPVWSGINTSRFVGKYTDPKAPWDALIIDYGAPIDLSAFNTFKIKVKTSVKGILKVKLEGGTSPGVEIDANITNTSDWVEYSFDFSDQFNANHQKLVIFFNAGVETSGNDVYYIDDLRFEMSTDPCNGVAPDLSVINDYDCQQNMNVPNTEIIATPQKNNVNDSKFSGKYVDGTGAWDAIVIDFGTTPINLTSNNLFSIKVNAPASAVGGIIKAKLEGGTSPAIEKDLSITKSGEWVQYNYDFSSEAAANHTRLVLFFNAGVDTGGTDVYYIDDLRFNVITDPCLGVTMNPSVINDFNCQQNTTIAGSLANSIIDNPKLDSKNPSNAVLQVTDNGTDAWDAIVFDNGVPIDLTTNNILKIKILSSNTKPIPLLAKLEGGTSPAKEVWGEIKVANDWTEYSFDFSDQANANQNKVVLFFNGGQTDGTTTDIYYLDDIQFKEKVVVPAPIFNMPFENNYTDIVSNTDPTIVGTPGFAGQSVQGTDAYAGATDSYLTFPTAGVATPEFSATMWYKLNNNPDRAGILVMGPEDINNAGYPSVQNLRTNGFRFFRENGDNGNQRFKLNVGDGNGDTWVDGGAAADVDPTTGNWIFLAITISNSQATVYIDGVQVAQSSFSGIDWTGCDILSIMSGAPRFTEWGHNSDNSYLDDLKFFNVELTLPQIEAIMNK